MINQKSYERIVQEIKGKINDVYENDAPTSARGYDEGYYNGKVEGLELALQLIEDYKDWYAGVTTPLGTLTVEESDQEEYCGYSVYLENEMVAAIEYESENAGKGLIVYIYGDLTDDDPTHIVKIKNIDEQLAKHDE